MERPTKDSLVKLWARQVARMEITNIYVIWVANPLKKDTT